MYVPKTLNPRDKRKQQQYIIRSRKLYKKGIYLSRPAVTFRSKPSRHVQNAKQMYGIDSIRPTKLLSKKTKCSLRGLNQIVKKGEGAYYSSGSRPNQTAQSWGYARLASALTGAKASMVDFDILKRECSSTSKALLLARGGIRTHEAEARDLKPRPFDRSGTRALQ